MPGVRRGLRQRRALYVSALGLPLRSAEGDDYLHSEDIEGAKHFGVWPLRQAAQACFGRDQWPSDRPVPQASAEFEAVDPEAVERAGAELEKGGVTLLHPARTEPWGRAVVRLQPAEGVIVGISYAPSLHRPTCAVMAAPAAPAAGFGGVLKRPF